MVMSLLRALDLRTWLRLIMTTWLVLRVAQSWRVTVTIAWLVSMWVRECLRSCVDCGLSNEAVLLRIRARGLVSMTCVRVIRRVRVGGSLRLLEFIIALSLLGRLCVYRVLMVLSVDYSVVLLVLLRVSCRPLCNELMNMRRLRAIRYMR